MIRFEWDERKNRTNLADHGVDFETAKLVFDDPSFVSFVESISEGGEERWHAIGLVGGIVILVVVHTYRVEGMTEVIRIISCRRATRHEVKLYHSETQ